MYSRHTLQNDLNLRYILSLHLQGLFQNNWVDYQYLFAPLLIGYYSLGPWLISVVPRQFHRYGPHRDLSKSCLRLQLALAEEQFRVENQFDPPPTLRRDTLGFQLNASGVNQVDQGGPQLCFHHQKLERRDHHFFLR